MSCHSCEELFHFNLANINRVVENIMIMIMIIVSVIVILIIWQYRNDYSKYWHQFWDYRYGNCFTFNGGMDDEYHKQTTLKTNQPGSSAGKCKGDN